jgi:L-threonylcarbamoyladenylate synthase
MARRTSSLPKIIKTDPDKADFRALAPAAQVLLDGGLVSGPTQSFYALMAMADRPQALERLSSLKAGREGDQAFLLLVDQEARVPAYATGVGPGARALMKAFWPGLLTLLLPGQSGLHPLLLGPSRNVGLRLEGLAATRGLIRMCDRGLTGTSANPHGCPPPTRASEVLSYFGDQLDLIVDAGPTMGGNPSTIVDACGPQPRLFRPGAIGYQALKEACPTILED